MNHTNDPAANSGKLWDVLSDDQKAEVLLVNAVAQNDNEKARIAAGEPAGLTIEEV